MNADMELLLFWGKKNPQEHSSEKKKLKCLKQLSLRGNMVGTLKEKWFQMVC